MATDRRLRSSTWFEGLDKTGFMHRAVQRQLGLPDHEFHGKPIIGICNSWSDLNPCNASLRELADHVKRGVWEAGGVPLEFPAMSLGEDTLRPNAMLFRNLAAMEVEELIRGNPLDGVVLLVGCDKTTPALLMGAASADLPTIVVSAGPLLSGRFRGRPIGTSDAWRFAEELSAGIIDHGRVPRGRARHQPLARHLPDHGHRLDHGRLVRGHGRGAAPQCRHPRRRREPSGAGPPLRQPHRRAGPRRPAAFPLPDADLLRQRHPRQRRHRRLDQRRHPSPGAGRQGRGAADPRRLGPPRPRRALHRQPQAVRRLPDGGVPRRRRLPGGPAHPDRGRPGRRHRPHRHRRARWPRPAPPRATSAPT